MFAGNPLLTFLGRKGRGAVLDALLEPQARNRNWTLRELARAAGVHAMAAKRAVAELEVLGVVEQFRPGRSMVIALQQTSAAAKALAAFNPPQLWQESVRTFAAAYQGPGSLVQYRRPLDRADDPLCPARIAILTRQDAWDQLDAGLDAVAAAGWPRPDVIVVAREELEGDEEGAAILAGEPIGTS
ncbi:MAG: hypothetical protein ACPHK8_04175 [Thermoplasmatota archaeon]